MYEWYKNKQEEKERREDLETLIDSVVIIEKCIEENYCGKCILL